MSKFEDQLDQAFYLLDPADTHIKPLVLEETKRQIIAAHRNAIEALLPKSDFPPITEWRQGKFIDKYSHMSDDWKRKKQLEEAEIVRMQGGTSNGFKIEGPFPAAVAEYLEKLGSNIKSALAQPKGGKTE